MIHKDLSDKILIIGPAPDMKGGIAQVLDNYFNEVFEKPKFLAEIVSGNAVRRAAHSVKALFQLMSILKKDKDIKVVHLHTATRVSFMRSSLYAKVAKKMGRKVILHVHGANFDDYYRKHKDSVRNVLTKSDRIVALSETWLKFFNDEVGINNVTVIPNIVNTPKVINKQESPDGKIHALFLGLLGDRKGIFDLLEVLHRLHDRLQGRFMLHVGGNGEVEKFKNTVSRLGLGDIVEFHGWVRADEKERLLNQSSIFLLPSYGEGLPISILEAMAYGNAIISTKIGGIPEVVDSTNGALMEPGDLDALEKALISMVDDKERTRAMGERSMQKVGPYKSGAVAEKLEEMYRSL